MIIRKFEKKDVPAMTAIWNEVVEEGNAFPQIEPMSEEEANDFFAGQTYTGVADEGGEIVGLYILHPNNIGRVGYIANASYAVAGSFRGKHTGEQLVKDSLVRAGEYGYKILQFNAVVASNVHAFNLYKRLGFTDLGIVPGCFENKDGVFEDIHVMYHEVGS